MWGLVPLQVFRVRVVQCAGWSPCSSSSTFAPVISHWLVATLIWFPAESLTFLFYMWHPLYVFSCGRSVLLVVILSRIIHSYSLDVSVGGSELRILLLLHLPVILPRRVNILFLQWELEAGSCHWVLSLVIGYGLGEVAFFSWGHPAAE